MNILKTSIFTYVLLLNKTRLADINNIIEMTRSVDY